MRISSLPALMSRPARGAWVEIHRSVTRSCAAGRAPQGARGLKYHSTHHLHRIHQSRPARGAWVEIRTASTMTQRFPRSRPARGAWVEIPTPTGCATGDPTSRPARGAWIETLPGFRYRIPPQKGSLCRSAETSFSFSIFTCRSSGLRSRHFSRPGGPWRGAGLHRSAGSARSRAHAGT